MMAKALTLILLLLRAEEIAKAQAARCKDSHNAFHRICWPTIV